MQNAVRLSCSRVCSEATHVQVCKPAVKNFVAKSDLEHLRLLCQRRSIDPDIHFCGDETLTAQYLLVLDAINFCFWPDHELEYHHLSSGLQKALLSDLTLFDAERLRSVQGTDVREWLRWPRPLPLEEERAQLIREVGIGLEAFEGSARVLIESAKCSALKLVLLLTTHFPGFRDQAVYAGENVYLYKRAQIFAGDVWGSFKGVGLGEFHDINELTMFADYRVPQLLLHLGILQYSPDLLEKLSNREVIPPGSAMEIEIRASSVVAVEIIKEEIKETLGEEVMPMSVQLDWWLWEKAESEELDAALQHRTITFYY